MHVTEQPAFLNAAVLGWTSVPPTRLIGALKGLEQEAGRDLQGMRWGPRPLDLDIIFYGSQQLDTEALTIPHPRC
jgi:2-amino-4-hydroxy-6-hydroxymethyldihydropteridine diphosphokinase